MAHTTPPPDEVFENLRLELRRGSLMLGVLARLREEHYGYTLRQALAEDGLQMEESTLYPLLRRLETQGLLVSEWREEERRRKRFYRLSIEGETMLKRLLDEWRRMNQSIDRSLQERTMDLIERYLHAVKSHLPLKQQDDVVAELGDDLRSRIDEREAELGRPLDESEVVAVLKSLGHPAHLAGKYGSWQQLIGPALFPMYVHILKFAMGLALLVNVVLAAVLLATGIPPARR